MSSDADFDLALPERVRPKIPPFRWVLREMGFWYTCMLFGPIVAAAILGFTAASTLIAGLCVAFALASLWYFIPRFWFMYRFMDALEQCDRAETLLVRESSEASGSDRSDIRGSQYAQLGERLANLYVPRESRPAVAGFRASIDELVAAYNEDDKSQFEDAAAAYVVACQRVWESSRLNKDDSEAPDGPLSRIHA